MKRSILLNLTVLLYSIALGQSNGDYRSRQTGNWNINATWEKYQGGAWVSPSPDFPKVNGIISVINIQNGHTVTATGNLRATAAAANISINLGGSLNMSAFTISGNATLGNKFPTIVINGTLNAASSVTSSTFTVGSTGTFITSYIGTNGWWSGTITPSPVALNGTVQYTGAATQKVPLYTHTNIIIGGTGAKNLVGTIIINGLLTINLNATLNMAAYTLTLNGSGILLNGVLQNSSGTITFGGVPQTISGTGSFSGTFANINIGTVTKSNTTLFLAGPVITNNLRIDKSAPNTGSSFTIGSSSRMQVLTSLDIFVNGGLILKSDAASTASLIVAAKGVNGGTANANVELFLAGTAAGTMWHYISPSISSAPATIFSAVSLRNVTKYKENFISTDMENGWVNYEGWHYNSATRLWEDMTSTQSWPNLLAGNGYNYYSTIDRTFTFTGQVNTANTSVTLAYNSAGGTPVASQHGYNLIGNPFTCGINWDLVVTYNNIWTNVEKTIYFRKNGLTYYYLNGVTVPNDYGDGRYIPPMQGFFLKSNLNNVTLTIPASARIHTSHPRYKSAEIIPMVRLLIESSGKSDQSVIRFDINATSNFDNSFDARKVFPAAGYPYIASTMAGTDLAINGLFFPTDSTEIPLDFIAPSAENYLLRAMEISALSNYNIWLNDKEKNIRTQLSDGKSYSFTSDAGKFPERFTISFAKSSVTTVPEVQYGKESFRLFTALGFLNIIPEGVTFGGSYGDIRIFDLTGRTLILTTKLELIRGQTIQIPFSHASGIYIVEIISQGKRFAAKFFNH